MSRKPSVVVGLDLAGSPKRPTGFCLLRGRDAETDDLFGDEEILAAVRAAAPALVAIDAPLNLPPGRTSIHERNDSHYRVCDLELRRRGIPPEAVLMVGNDFGRDLLPASHLGCRTALFAGDARSYKPASGPDAAGRPDALLTALAHDETLYTDAYRAKIILVTPSTLMAVLKLVEGMWVFQRRKESADKIAEAGRKLFEKLTVFSNTFVEIGAAIEKAHGTFEKARGQLASGKGNTIRLAQRMLELGVQPAPGKVMPPELVTLAEEGPEDGGDDEDTAAVERPESP